MYNNIMNIKKTQKLITPIIKDRKHKKKPICFSTKKRTKETPKPSHSSIFSPHFNANTSKKSCLKDSDTLHLSSIYTHTTIEQTKQDNTVKATPISFDTFLKQIPKKSTLNIQHLHDATLTKLTHQSQTLGPIEISLKQEGSHTLFYNLKSLYCMIPALQALLPALLQNLQKTLPHQTHHIHDVSLKKSEKKKNGLIKQSESSILQKNSAYDRYP